MRRVCLIVILILVATPAFGLDLLIHGSDAQASGGLGIVTTSGASALHYNPASLAHPKSTEVFAEAGYLNLSYSYTFPEFDPAVVKVQTPFIFTGGSIPVTDWLSIGANLFPVPGGSPGLEVTNIPTRQLSQNPALINVLTENTSSLDYTFATGFAVTNRRWLSLGACYIQEKQETRTTVSDSESGGEIFSLDSRVVSQSGIVGLNVRPIRYLRLGLKYQSVTKSLIKGSFLNEGGQTFSGKAHKGQQFGGGVKASYSSFSAWAEGLFRQFSKNTGNLSPFAATNPVTPESFDATSFSVGLGLKVGKRHRFKGGFGWHPTAVGSGFMAEDPLSPEELPGIQFGDLDAISRKLFSGGYRYTGNSFKVNSAISIQTGTRYVGETSRGTGDYSLTVFMLTSGVAWRF